MLLDPLRKTVKKYDLLPAGCTVLAGVSGGPDSMALLHALNRLAPEMDWELFAVHVNHQLRGEASEEDERYVISRCREWGIPCHVERVDVAGRLKREGGNKQAVARRLRYDAFHRVAEQRGADRLALAHQADDQAETLLMRLLRGAGPPGMAGIPIIRDWRGIRIVRPLLHVFREEVEAYCREHAIHPREDTSNRDPRFTRNRIRMELIPLLTEYNPRIKELLLQFSRVAADEEKWWRKWVEEATRKVTVSRRRGEITLDVSGFLRLDIALQRRVIKLILNCLMEENESTLHAVEEVRRLAGRTNPSARVDLPGGVRAEREYRLLRVLRNTGKTRKPRPAPYISTTLSVPGTTSIPRLHGRMIARIDTAPPFPQATEGRMAVFDADLLKHPLSVRNRRPGDRMRPKGLNGTKKVKEILIDAKVPRRLRDTLPLVLHGEEIVWIPGVSRSDWALVSEETERYLVLIWKEADFRDGNGTSSPGWSR